MRAQLAAVAAVFFVSCVAAPPTPCTECDGKCVDTNTDSKNCGECGKSCASGNLCSAGKCVAACNSGQQACATGCSDPMTDAKNCGGCGRPCAAGQVCSGGSCAASCGTTYTACPVGTDTVCADVASDSRHCGMCNHACGTGEVCSAMQCGVRCTGTQTMCNPGAVPPYCVDTKTDNASCGACAQPCPQGTACNAGVCDTVCASPLLSCTADAGGAAHYCADPQTDSRNCGGCGVRCDATQACISGTCRAVVLNNCDDVKTFFGGTTVDSEWTLNAAGLWYLPFRAWCADMNGLSTTVLVDGGVVDGGYGGPKTYLILDRSERPQLDAITSPGIRSDGGANFSEHNNDRFPQFQPDGGCTAAPAACYLPNFTNTFSKLRLDTPTNTVSNDDYRFSTVRGTAQNVAIDGLEYGTAAGCVNGSANGRANIDLRNTPFAVDPSNVWALAGSNPVGSASLSQHNKVVNVTGGGFCGANDLTANPGRPHKLLLRPSGRGCAELKSLDKNAPSGVYSLFDGKGPDAGTLRPPLVYCDMTSSGGGWSLVLKVDGNNPASRFYYDDTLWTNVATYGAAVPDLSKSEAKYAAFMATPYNEVRLTLGEADGGVSRSLEVNTSEQGSMLDTQRGGYLAFGGNRGAGGWTSFFHGTPVGLQGGCQQEGFVNAPSGTARARVRIGILGNEQPDCGSTDSFAGVGGQLQPNNCGGPNSRGNHSAGIFGAPTCAGGPTDEGQFVYVWVR
ncbi:MAG: hypothetical protein IPJ65_00915 [Archangiaceae bacterium]|nr:hypothetical protein [Archangiaceae bacterium]